MVGGVVDRVDTDGVDSQLLELGNVSLASGGVCDGVFGAGRASGLVIDTTDVEALIASEESCCVLVNVMGRWTADETCRFP